MLLSHRVVLLLILGDTMLEFGFYNMDCMEGMQQFPDKYFDLAIVDPPYGISVASHKGGALVGGGPRPFGGKSNNTVYGKYGKCWKNARAKCQKLPFMDKKEWTVKTVQTFEKQPRRY